MGGHLAAGSGPVSVWFRMYISMYSENIKGVFVLGIQLLSVDGQTCKFHLGAILNEA